MEDLVRESAATESSVIVDPSDLLRAVQIVSGLEEEREKLKEDVYRSRESVEMLEQELRTREMVYDENMRLKEELMMERNQLDREVEKIVNARKLNDEIQLELQSQIERREELEARLQTAQEKVEVLGKQMEKQRKSYQTSQSKLEDAQFKLESTNETVVHLQNKTEKLRKTSAEQQKLIESLQLELKFGLQSEKEIAAMTEEWKRREGLLSNRIKTMQEELEQKDASIDQLENHLEYSNQTISDSEQSNSQTLRQSVLCEVNSEESKHPVVRRKIEFNSPLMTPWNGSPETTSRLSDGKIVQQTLSLSQRLREVLEEKKDAEESYQKSLKKMRDNSHRLTAFVSVVLGLMAVLLVLNF